MDTLVEEKKTEMNIITTEITGDELVNYVASKVKKFK
jgi:hypothetical protein